MIEVGFRVQVDDSLILLFPGYKTMYYVIRRQFSWDSSETLYEKARALRPIL